MLNIIMYMYIFMWSQVYMITTITSVIITNLSTASSSILAGSQEETVQSVTGLDSINQESFLVHMSRV